MGEFWQTSAQANPRSSAKDQSWIPLALTLSLLTTSGIAFGAFAKSSLAMASGSNLSRYKDRRLSKIDPGDPEGRWEAYRTVDGVFHRLWLKPVSKTPLKSAQYPTYKSYPLLVLEDRNGDGKAGFFAYLSADGSSRTQEFGAFFRSRSRRSVRLDRGLWRHPVRQEDEQFLFHHHCIDTNGDGLFDFRVYGAIDMDGDGFPEENATAWLYGVDHDGLVDKAEHIVRERVSAIEPDNGALRLRYYFNTDPSHQPQIGGPMPTTSFESVKEDIDDLASH